MEANPFDLLDTEAQRLDRFYTGLRGTQWREPTRCAGWDRKDLLAHLASVEDYTRACLDDRVAEYASQASDGNYETLNDVLVARRSGTAPEELLAEWRTKLADNHRQLRERGAGTSLATSAGRYPLERQAYYLACELAIHADDAGVPEVDGEHAARLAWRLAFGLDALAEVRPELAVVSIDGYRAGYTVHVKDVSATLSPEDFVAATSGRLPDDSLVPPSVRQALKVLA